MIITNERASAPMEKRIAINADDYAKILKGREAKGSSFTELSPYDIPKVIGVEMKDGRLHVHFEYVDNEPESSVVLESGVRVKLGKHSGKMLSLEVDKDDNSFRDLAEKVAKALSHFRHNAKKFNQKANYDLTDAVFEKNREPLLVKG
ncbi:MAG: hypothetical protein KF876_12130 [Nitrospira sp.]|nr:hypothetical protein [Nitrospira sp.]